MKRNRFYKYIIKKAYFLISLFIISNIVFSCQKKINESNKKTVTSSFHTPMKKQFQSDLSNAISYLDSIKLDTTHTKQYYKASRKFFKLSEPILAFLDVENYGYLNQPNILKVDEDDFTDIKIKKNSGYQVLEEEIFKSNPNYKVISEHASITSNRLRLIQKNTGFQHLKEYHILWLIRDAIIRTAVTGITGFDSPVLENSLEESKFVYQSLQNYLQFFTFKFKDDNLINGWKSSIKNSINTLSSDNFNDFNRYEFIKQHTHPQLTLWRKTVKDWKVTFPFELAINNEATSLFSDQTFNINHFSDKILGNFTSEKVNLGKVLFYDTNLSNSKKISCATCHQPSKAFTDGKKIGEGVTRNSPTLFYAALQKGFFYDKRAGSLEGQIVSVVNNENEFHTNLETLKETILNDTTYVRKFAKAYPNNKITNLIIRNAIASYIRSLTPFNSKFDKNINSIDNTLTQSEINGYNLFNGKAKCATCHFAPLFNGTIPPSFKESEIELIGVPQNNDTVNAKISEDLGRYYVYKTPERKHFFKTPTLRNISKTAPYMHNGVYNSLFEVMDFYNRGGGAGIGIHQEYQTLPTTPLNLTKKETEDIIEFMKSLEDSTTDHY